MMRCIENAIAANHITRSAGDELDKRVKAMLREGLAPPEVRERLTAELAAKEKLAKRRALLMELRRKALSETVLNYKNVKGEIDPAEALWLLIENDGRGNMASVQRLTEAIRGRAQGDLEQLMHEFRKGWLTGDLRRRQDAVVAQMSDVVRELFGEDSGNGRAKVLAKGFAAVAETLRQRFNAAGGNIQKIDKWALPQAHDSAQLLAIGQGPWVDYLMRPGTLDRARMINHETGKVLSDDELREALREVWKKITTDGWIDREPGYAAYGKGALARQADDKHRFLHFASADAWLDYQRAFKSGDPMEAMMGHIGMMARDIATMEILGPSPEIMRNYLKQLVLQRAATVEPLGRIAAEKLATIADVMRRVVPGDAGERFLADFDVKLRALADAEAAARAGGAAGKAADDLARSIDDLIERLKMMEPETIGAERARLTDRLFEIEAERAAVGAKGAPQVGVSKRNKRRLAALADEARDVQARLDAIDTGDNSLFVAEPQAYAEMVQAANDMRAAAKEIRAGGLGYVRDPMDAARASVKRHDAMWDIVRGTHFAPVNESAADWGQVVRNWNVSVLLGSAMVTALSDIGLQRTARKLAGLDSGFMTIITGYLTMMKSMDRQEAISSFLGLDAMVHMIHNTGRYNDGMMGIGSMRTGQRLSQRAVTWSGFVADRVISASGLAWWTQAGKWAFGMDLMSDMAGHVRKFDKMTDLPERLQRTLRNGGFTPDDWAALRATALHERHIDMPAGVGSGTARWLRPNEIAQGPGGEALAEKYLMMIHTLTRHAVIEGTVRSRSIMDFGRPGTLAGEIGRTALQFKSFGIAVVLQHMAALTREFRVNGFREGAKRSAEFLVITTLLGALVSELYEIINGRDPVLPKMLAERKLPPASYWIAAAMKGGGLGIYGDYLLAPVGKAGQGLVSTMAGPTVGQIDRLRGASFSEVIEWWEENGDKHSKMRDAGWIMGPPKDKTVQRSIEASKVLTPGGSLWWLRLAKERLILNQLHKWQDPEGFERVTKRHEKLQRKRLGNGYWWRPGDLYPGQSGQGGGGPRRM